MDESDKLHFCEPKSTRRGGYRIKKNQYGETELHRAVINNQLSQCEKLLEKGHPVNVADNYDWYPLHEACNHGRTQIVQLLLRRKDIDVDKAGGKTDKLTPMMDAAQCGFYEIVEMLLNRGASITKLDNKNQTVLNYLENNDNSNENPSDALHRRRLIEHIENEMKRQNFIPPPLKGSTKNLKRSEKLNMKKRQKFENVMKNCLKGDDSLDDEISSDKQNIKSYHNAINDVGKSALQRPLAVVDLVDDEKPSLIPADHFEVQDDWLDDDLGLFKRKKVENRRRKKRYVSSSSDSDRSVKNADDTFDDIISPTPGPSSTEDVYDDGLQEEKIDNDVELVADEWTPNRTPSWTFERAKKRKMRQTKLNSHVTRSRNVDVRQVSPNFGRTNNVGVAPKQIHVVPPPQPMFTAATNVSIAKPKNKIVVKIDNTKLLVPIFDSDLEKSVEWLANEAAMRYSSNHGRKPLLRLLDAENVEIGVHDPVSLFVNDQLVAQVLGWDVLPLHTKYEEVCKKLNSTMYTNIKEALRKASTTDKLVLENIGCRGVVAANVLKTIQNSYGLTMINLRGNRVTIENAKDLGAALAMLKNLDELTLRNTGFTNEHLKSLMTGVQTTENQIIPVLRTFDLSYNLLDDDAEGLLEKFLHLAPSLANLLLNNCDFLTCQVVAKGEGLSISRTK